MWYGAVAEGGGGGVIEEGEGSDEERAKRNELRLALARRMKQDLLLTEQEKLAKMQVRRPHKRHHPRFLPPRKAHLLTVLLTCAVYM